MMKSVAKNLFPLFSILLSISACAPSKSDSSRTVNPRQIVFVKGNPLNMVAGARLNKVSPFAEAKANDWNSYILGSTIQFDENEPVKIAGSRNLEAENATQDSTQSAKVDLHSLRFEKAKDGSYILSLMNQTQFLFFEIDKNGSLNPVRMKTQGATTAVQVVHWSMSQNGRYFSLLVSGELRETGRFLLELNFEKPGPWQKLDVGDLSYIYTSGPGQKVGWRVERDHALEIELCGASQQSDAVRKAVEQWSRALEGRLTLHFSQTDVYAPFSDVNQHCVYVVDSYITDQDPKVANYGYTVSAISLSNAEIYDADVFLFVSEFNKHYGVAESSGTSSDVAKKEIERILPMTIVHELGHLLGLGHKFDGTASVMSYEWKYGEPQPYDIDALHALYPALSNSN